MDPIRRDEYPAPMDEKPYNVDFSRTPPEESSTWNDFKYGVGGLLALVIGVPALIALLVWGIFDLFK
jgi:hypothetical protein